MRDSQGLMVTACPLSSQAAAPLRAPHYGRYHLASDSPPTPMSHMSPSVGQTETRPRRQRCVVTTGVPATNFGDEFGSTLDEAAVSSEDGRVGISMRASALDDKAKLNVLKQHVKKLQKETEDQTKEWESRVAVLTEDLEREQRLKPHTHTYTHTHTPCTGRFVHNKTLLVRGAQGPGRRGQGATARAGGLETALAEAERGE